MKILNRTIVIVFFIATSSTTYAFPSWVAENDERFIAQFKRHSNLINGNETKIKTIDNRTWKSKNKLDNVVEPRILANEAKVKSLETRFVKTMKTIDDRTWNTKNKLDHVVGPKTSKNETDIKVLKNRIKELERTIAEIYKAIK